MDAGCYNMVTLKNMLEKVKQKFSLQRFAANKHKNEKFAANVVNQRFMVNWRKSWHEGVIVNDKSVPGECFV